MAGIKCFHVYLYNRTLELVTDNKPLLGLLAGDCPMPQVLSPWMLWWMVFLAAYSYQLIYHPDKSLGHADALICCPLLALVEDSVPASSSLLIKDLPAAPVSASDMASLSAQDHTIDYVLKGVEVVAEGSGVSSLPAFCFSVA